MLLTQIITNKYEKSIPLTKIEVDSLFPYSVAGVAMEFMGAHQEKFINQNNTKETDFWLELGRAGLKEALS